MPGGEARHASCGLGGGSRAPERQVRFRARPLHEMDVGIRDPRRDRGATGVDHLRARTDEIRDGGVRAERQDALPPDRDGIGARFHPARRPRARVAHDEVGMRPCHDPASTRFSSTPMPSISTSIRSPTWTGATPAGVPLAITSPGSSVMMDEMKRISSGTGNSRS